MPDLTFTLSAIPSRTPSVVSQRAGQEVVLVLPLQGKVKVLNEVGARIWDLCDGGHSVRQIASTICREYTVESSQAEADTLSFLNELAQRGVVSLVR